MSQKPIGLIGTGTGPTWTSKLLLFEHGAHRKNLTESGRTMADPDRERQLVSYFGFLRYDSRHIQR